jgi:hypothetical protein
MLAEGKMIILWIRKKKAEKHNWMEKNETELFHQHDDVMKRFRLAHPDINMYNAKDILTEEGNLLSPIHQVKLPANIQN